MIRLRVTRGREADFQRAPQHGEISISLFGHLEERRDPACADFTLHEVGPLGVSRRDGFAMTRNAGRPFNRGPAIELVVSLNQVPRFVRCRPCLAR